MASSIEHNAGQVQATKNGAARRRRRALLDDHAALDRDERNFWALEWSRGITYKVLIVLGRTSASPDDLCELHGRLFPGGWPALRNLHDGWIARAFQRLTYADLNPRGIPDPEELRNGRIRMMDPPGGGLPTTMQLGAMLGWDWPIHKPNDGSGEEIAALAEGFRRRYAESKGNPAQMWHNRRMRNARAVRDLEGRINTEGVRVEWSEEPMVEPCFRPISGDDPAVTIAHVSCGALPV